MQILNKRIEAFMKNVYKDEHESNMEVINKEGIEIDTNVEGYGFDAFKIAMEYVSNQKYDDLMEGSTIKYMKYCFNRFRMNRLVYDYLTVSRIEIYLKQLERETKEKYNHYPVEQQEEMWFNDWVETKGFKGILNYNLVWHYKKKLKEKNGLKKDPQIIEVDNLKEVFPEAYKIFVCEELKSIYCIGLTPVYSSKHIEVALMADYNNSPYFDERYITKDEEELKKYKEELDLLAQKVGYEKMNEEALLEFINKKNERRIRINWRIYASNHMRKGILQKRIESIENENLKDILNSYLIYGAEYLYKPFIDLSDNIAQFMTGWESTAYCAYRQCHTKGIKNVADRQRRIDSAGYVTDYYNVDRSKTYDYTEYAFDNLTDEYLKNKMKMERPEAKESN